RSPPPAWPRSRCSGCAARPTSSTRRASSTRRSPCSPRRRKLSSALHAPHASANTLPEPLAPADRQPILDEAQKIRQEQAEKKEQADRAQRIAKGMEAGPRLLEQGKAAEAKVQFEDVLAVDPRNAQAQDGKRQAEESIL